MDFLIVGGIPVPVATDGVSHAVEEIGSRVRMRDGSCRSTVRARKSTWTITTTLLTRAAAGALVAVLVGTPPVACSGDLLGGTINCVPEYLGLTAVPTASGVKYRVRFTLYEA